MENANGSEACSVFLRLCKKGLIILSLLALASCSFGAKPVPTAQQPSLTEAASATQNPFEPINVIQNQTENGGIVQGELTDTQLEAANSLINQAPDAAEVYATQGVIQSVITGAVEIVGQTPEARVETYFAENADLYNLGQFSQDFQQVNQFDQQNGAQVRQYQQVVGGIPVYQADMRVTLDSEGNVTLVNSNYMPESHLPQSLDPKMSPAQAKKAMQALEFEVFEETTPTLVIYSPAMVGEGGRAFLAWVTKAGWEGGYGDVLIKDFDGSLVSKSTDILTFTYEISDCEGEVYSSNNLLTSDEIATKPKLSGTTTLNDVNEQRIGPLIENFSHLFDFYEEKFGYKEYLTADSEIQILVNLSYTGIDYAFYWRDDTRSIPILIAFPEKDLENNLEVIAHEFQHSVNEDFVILRNGESIALAEAFSNLFEAVADTSERRWQINNADLVYYDMANPVNGVGIVKAPDHMNDFIKDGDPHDNSMIIDHAFYLMSEGGEKNGIKVHKIGIDRVAQIVFYSLARLNHNATFIQARNAMVLTCENLIEKGELSDNYCNQVRNAFAAVGIGESAQESNTPKAKLTGLQFGWQLAPNVAVKNSDDAYAEIAQSGFNIVREVFPWDQIQT